MIKRLIMSAAKAKKRLRPGELDALVLAYMAPQGFSVPIVETHTGEEFPTSWDAAIKYGLIDRDILLAIQNKTFVWPTYQFFKTIT